MRRLHDTAFMDWLLSLICHHFFTVTVRPCRFAVINNGYHAWNAFVTFHEQILIIILHIIILVIKWERRVKLIFGHYLTCRRRMRSSPRSCRRPSTRPRICVRRSFWYVKLFYSLQIAISGWSTRGFSMSQQHAKIFVQHAKILCNMLKFLCPIC